MKRWMLGTMMGLALAGGAYAQSLSATGINRRRENQQQRIASGIASGQLTAGEATRLERQESQINREVRIARRANGGQLTPAERARVNRQLNRESRRIYILKHNAIRAPR
jgi:hypothetical protein